MATSTATAPRPPGKSSLPGAQPGAGARAKTCEDCKKRCQAGTNVAEQKETDDAFDRGEAGVVDLFAETVYLEYNKLAVCDKKCAHLCK